MAYSSSIKRAQAIKFCELCQEDSIKWRCVDCDRCLCEKCKISHLRIPITAQHQIVTIGTPLQDVQKKIITDNIPCKDHSKKMTCLFCRSCDSLICPDCASSSHKRHNFDSIESVLKEKLDYLRSIHDKIDTNLKCCESKTSEIKNSKPKYNAIFDDSVTNIKQREQELIDVIRKHSKTLQEKVEKEKTQVISILLKIQQDVDNQRKNLEDKKEEINAILSSSQGGIIFKASVGLKDVKFDSLPNQVDQFIPDKESTKKIQELFGSFQNLSIPTTQVYRPPPKMEFEVIKTFNTDLPYIDTVVTLDKTSAWISCWNKQVIRKVDIHDNTMSTSQEVSLGVNDMALTSTNEILLSLVGHEDVKLLKKSGEVVSFVTFAPLLPRGIHVTKDNDVIVGVKEPGNKYTPTDKSQRALTVFDMSGKQKQRYQYDRDGQRLFNIPDRITTNYNQDILVVDRTSGSAGRVVDLNKEGNLKWLYEGHDKINDIEQFDPRDIITTTAGHIIISDFRSNALHVLSQDGDILTCKVVRDMGIMYAWGLDIDNEGKLWVGSFTGEKTGTKLQIIKLCA